MYHVEENMMKFERRIVNSVVGIEVGNKMIKKEGSEIVELWIFRCFLMMDWHGPNRWLSLQGF